ncbi:hypothetical protein VCHE45_0648 [Vibrio cholerae HE-45]|nr:hypothetical protein VCHE45_0648 [Vibrio cholerae HE-45]
MLHDFPEAQLQQVDTLHPLKNEKGMYPFQILWMHLLLIPLFG